MVPVVTQTLATESLKNLQNGWSRPWGEADLLAEPILDILTN